MQELLTSGEDRAGRSELRIDGVIGQELCDRQLVSTATNLGFFAEQTETRHGRQHGINVNTPQIHEEHHLYVNIHACIIHNSDREHPQQQHLSDTCDIMLMSTQF